MKRFVCILFILLMILPFGCKKEDRKADPTPFVTATPKPTKEPEKDLDLPYSATQHSIGKTHMIIVYDGDPVNYGWKIKEAIDACPDGDTVSVSFFSGTEQIMTFSQGTVRYGILADKRSGEEKKRYLETEEDLFYQFPSMYEKYGWDYFEKK